MKIEATDGIRFNRNIFELKVLQHILHLILHLHQRAFANMKQCLITHLSSVQLLLTSMLMKNLLETENC